MDGSKHRIFHEISEKSNLQDSTSLSGGHQVDSSPPALHDVRVLAASMCSCESGGGWGRAPMEFDAAMKISKL